MRRTSFRYQPAAGLLAILGLLLVTLDAASQVVTNPDDSGPGSLRQVLANAPAGETVTFDASLSGATIGLKSEISLGKNVVIDATSLPAG